MTDLNVHVTRAAAASLIAPPASKTLLTADDLAYRGYFKAPLDYQVSQESFKYSNGALAGRYVNGTLHLFLAGTWGQALGEGDWTNWDSPYEILVPAPNTLGTTINTAPRASLATRWGTTFQPLLENTQEFGAGAGSQVLGFAYCNDYLWASYGYYYNTSGWHDPSIVAVKFNDNNGTVTTYGPFRTTEHAQRTRGYFMVAPTNFANTYLNAQRLCVGAQLTSGGANCWFGTGLVALRNDDPTTLTAAHWNDATVSFSDTRLIAHIGYYPQPRIGPNRYKICRWNQVYDCGYGAITIDGPADFAGSLSPTIDGPTGESTEYKDKILAAVWIDTPTKRGIIVFGEIADIVPGFSYATDGMPHVRYSDDRVCCHGHPRNYNSGTGPNCDTMRAVAYILDPNQLAEVAADPPTRLAGDLDWSGEIYLSALMGYPDVLPDNLGNNIGGDQYAFGGAWYDDTTGLLYLSQNSADTSGGNNRPVIHVFQVAS